MGVIKNGHGHLVRETLKSALYLKNELMSWADFLHVECDAIIFGYTNIALYIFDF